MEDNKIILKSARQEAEGLGHILATEDSDQDLRKAESNSNDGENHRLGHVLRQLDQRESLGLEELLGEDADPLYKDSLWSQNERLKLLDPQDKSYARLVHFRPKGD